LQQSQAYNLYLKETTVSFDHLKMLASGECSLLKIVILYIQENCSIQILKGASFKQLNMKISQEPLIWRRVWR